MCRRKSSRSGPSLFHEHLSMRFPLGATEHFTDDMALMIEEARAAKADGIAAIVDGGHADMDRSVDALKRISTESGPAGDRQRRLLHAAHVSCRHRAKICGSDRR